MIYEELIVLIPSHSLEDFPTDLPESQAASLLNAFAVAWHPLLLASASALPRWHRADSPPEIVNKRLFLVPTKCIDTIPCGWVERARSEGAVVVADLTERDQMLAEALGPLEASATVDPDLAADFLALGFCTLQVELLTRAMRHYGNLDEVHMQREALAAANAALSGDAATARTHLKSCFEVLTETRERFYPVDCYLIDLCLLIPRLADEHLAKTLVQLKPLNIVASAEDLDEIARSKPELLTSLREAWERGGTALVGGEFREAPTPLLPLESVLWEFAAGRETIRRLFKRSPVVWGRRRFGLFPQLPQILQRFGFQAAMHVAMDDGIYPDSEHSKVLWEGTNGTSIDAISRIPLAAEGANSYLRFPARMAESMDHDHVATVLFARWPEVKAPWFDDLRRMHEYSPVLGRFVTLEDYFQHTDSPGRMSGNDRKDYLSPFLVQAVAYQESNPVSRYAEHFRRRQEFDRALWFHALRQVLASERIGDPAFRELEQSLELADPVTEPEKQGAIDSRLAECTSESGRQLAEIVLGGSGSQAGYLLLNSLSFSRKVSVALSELISPPAIEGAVRFVQWDATRKVVTLEIPGAGFVWLPLDSGAPAAKGVKATALPMAETNVLRNEFFEVFLNASTGGIGKLKGYGRKPNRLSHQLAFRFPRERKLPREEEAGGELRTYYSQMRLLDSRVTCGGPSLGEIVTSGEILDQVSGTRLAGFRQTYRIWRGRPILEVEVELEIERLPEGDPWSNYYAARFAWNDSGASLTRAVMMGAQEVGEERFESPHYVEIANDSERTTILNSGLAFHRKTGDRMVDSLLVVAGETRRSFRFTIAVDENYPMQAALDALCPVLPVLTKRGPPTIGRSGWFFHLSAKNVQMTRILDRVAEPPEHADPFGGVPDEAPASGHGCGVRLVETEGRPVRVQLRCFRAPLAARQRDFLGRTMNQLTINGDSVTVDLTAFEVADVELTFG